jgi:hypothetical protein
MSARLHPVQTTAFARHILQLSCRDATAGGTHVQSMCQSTWLLPCHTCIHNTPPPPLVKHAAMPVPTRARTADKTTPKRDPCMVHACSGLKRDNIARNRHDTYTTGTFAPHSTHHKGGMYHMPTVLPSPTRSTATRWVAHTPGSTAPVVVQTYRHATYQEPGCTAPVVLQPCCRTA